MFKSLFCLSSSSISGGNNVLLEFASLLRSVGQQASVYFCESGGTISNAAATEALSAQSLDEALSNDWDFVFFSNLHLVPLALPCMHSGVPVLISQGYESFCYGSTLKELLEEKPAFSAILELPIEIIATSRSVQSLLESAVRRPVSFVPVPFDSSRFSVSRQQLPALPRRIAMVGNYLMPLKGMPEGFQALQLLSAEMAVQLVLITQQKHSRNILPHQSLPIEIHFQPRQEDIPDIYASCHAYLCSSWYEGLGLPCLESMAAGTPVVCTRNFGVMDFGKDFENILLANAGDPQDMASRLKLLLSDQDLYVRLQEGGRHMARTYDRQSALDGLLSFQRAKLGVKPPRVDSAVLDQLMENLRLSGFYTPVAVQQKWRSISARFDKVCQALSDGESGSLYAAELQEIKDEIENEIVDRGTEYFRLFKPCYDACRMIQASLADSRISLIAAAMRGRHE